MIQWRVHRGTEKRFESLRTGFREFVPAECLSEFTERELEVCVQSVPWPLSLSLS